MEKQLRYLLFASKLDKNIISTYFQGTREFLIIYRQNSFSFRVFEGNLSHITTLCDAEYQEQILEEALKRVQMRKVTSIIKNNSLASWTLN